MSTPKRNKFQKDESRLRKLALAFPQTAEDFPWGHRAIKVRGKIFLVLSHDDGKFRVTMKLPGSNKSALRLPFASPTRYGLGKSGWVTFTFETAASVPVEMLEDWIDESYRAVAPKKLVAELEDKPPRHL